MTHPDFTGGETLPLPGPLASLFLCTRPKVFWKRVASFKCVGRAFPFLLSLGGSPFLPRGWDGKPRICRVKVERQRGYGIIAESRVAEGKEVTRLFSWKDQSETSNREREGVDSVRRSRFS